jgi:hypothetical protein
MNDHYNTYNIVIYLKFIPSYLLERLEKKYKMILQVSHFSRPRDKKG